MEREALTLEALAIAMAVRNSGGIVIVQVERLADSGSLNARQVKVPGILVDCVVVAEKPDHHWQTFATPFSAAFSGEIRAPHELDPADGDERAQDHCPARRHGAQGQQRGQPWHRHAGRASPASRAEEKIIDLITLTAEPGVVGGIPAGGLNFGAATNTQAIIDQPYQFDFYDGGGLDVAFLGLAQADREGNLNVSRFGTKLAGAGGFINISQNAKEVVFVGTFNAGKLRITVENGALRILEDGRARKFVSEVEHRTFSGSYARQRGQPVLYITERWRLQAGRERT